MITTLLTIFLILCVVGLILWGIGQIPGIPPVIKTVIYVVVGVLILVWLINQLGAGSLSLN